ncbi:MAG: EscU/YscU/HrcU family type III secretion system export apparatus switch protein, partial [Methylobacteriaceae bacterium]|nr:EscU/YscU/HrcU family type III secretion system export apparatus switch protein [Methylobacteriaceae bacterium]
MAGGGEGQEDRTEEPSARRLDEATKRGDVPRSVELSTFLALGALTLSLPLAASAGSATGFALDLRAFLMNAHLVPDTPAGLMAASRYGLTAALVFAAIPLGLLCLAALASGLAQHRPLLTVEPLTPKLERLSPLAGLKRIFGREAMVQFVKSLLKLGLVGTLAGWILWSERDRLEAIVGIEPGPFGSVIRALTIKFLGALVAAYAVVTIADFLYARFSWTARQRMTKQEVKDDHREQEG